MKNFQLTKKEILHLLAATLILGFIFSFREWGTTSFDLIAGLTNWMLATILVAIALLIHEYAHKLVAKRYSATTEFKLWSMRRYGWKQSAKLNKDFPLGILISLFVAFLSNGKLIIAALESSEIEENAIQRSRKRFPHLTQVETALIALAGPLASALLALLLKGLGTSNPVIAKAILINALIAVYALLPLPGLDGIKIAASSIAFYIFIAVVIGGAMLLMAYMSPLLALIIALALASVAAVLYLYRTQ